jgi:hypothetical protein
MISSIKVKIMVLHPFLPCCLLCIYDAVISLRLLKYATYFGNCNQGSISIPICSCYLRKGNLGAVVKLLLCDQEVTGSLAKIARKNRVQ